MKTNHFPSYTIPIPYDILYRKECSPTPVGPHTHNITEIYFTLSELKEVLLNGNLFQVPKNTLIVIPPFCVHQLYHTANVEYERYILSVSPDWIEQIFFEGHEQFSYLKNPKVQVILELSNENAEIVIDSFQKYLRASKSNPMEATITFCSLFTQIHQLLQSAPIVTDIASLQASPSQQRVNEIIQYINDHLTESITINSIAKHFFLNPDYLERFFKKHMHTSISSYITLQKITKAQYYLKEGKTVRQVQEMLGYSSYAYFSKIFKKNTGIAPGAYRKKGLSFIR